MRKFLFAVFFLIPLDLSAYTFGKNKYETKQYRWKVSETQHYRIFYYQGEQFLSTFAASILEKTFTEYSDLFGFKPQDKIPVIIYASYKDFQETNVIPGIIEEGVGGFTEVLKNRVVVPFSGSYKDFRHVLRHELVHVFQYLVIKNNYRNFLYSSILNTIPLWVMEGMAEYLSLGWDMQTEAYIRDLSTKDKILPIRELNYYGGYIVYKEGQLIYRYIAENYGKKACTRFFNNLVYSGNFSKAIEETFGTDFEDFDRKFTDYARETFYPSLSNKELAATTGNTIIDHEKWRNYLNTCPVFSHDGSKVYIMSDKSGRTDIYEISLLGEVKKRIVKGESTPDFESIHVLRPGYDVSPDNREFVIATQTGKGDALFILNLKNGKIILKKHFGLDAIYTPVFSPSGRYIAFSGIKDGKEDIYIYNRGKDSLYTIAKDYYDDKDPRFLNDTLLLFVSDRNNADGFSYGRYAIFEYNTLEHSIQKLSPYREVLKEPFVLTKHGHYYVYFVADDSGSINLFSLNLSTNSYKKITNIVSMVINFSVRKDGTIVFSALSGGGYDVILKKSSGKNTLFNETGNEFMFSPVEYIIRTKLIPTLSLDYVHGFMTYMSGFGIQGLLYLGLSDELGDRRLDIVTDLSGDIANSNFTVSYTYLPKRLDHVFSIYQFTDAFYDYQENFYLAKETGISWDMYYPFNKFSRLEGGFAFERYKSDIWLSQSFYTRKYTEIGYNIMPRIGLVYDNTLFTPYGDPWKGFRCYEGLAKSIPLSSKFYNLGVLFSDNRYYIALSKKMTIALRGIAGKSMGRDKYVFYLGGPETLRGFDYQEFTGTSLFLFNTELRTPFIEYLKLGFPLPIQVSGIKGIMFFDAGSTWETQRPRFVRHNLSLEGLKADIGLGLRLNIGLGYLKLDWAWKTDLRKIEHRSVFNISIGNYF